jgi:predicted dehydrogenase
MGCDPARTLVKRRQLWLPAATTAENGGLGTFPLRRKVSSPATLRIGLVGCGRWGKNILRDLVSLECEVHVVARDIESKENALANGAHEIVDTVSTLSCHLDGYVVAVSTTSHQQVVEKLASRGRPIYVEKPLTNDSAGAEKLVNLAGEKLFVMDKWRYHPGVNAIRDLVKSGTLGKLCALHLRRRQWGSVHSDVDPVWILLPHDLTIVLHLLGNIPEPVFAKGLGADSWLSAITVHLGGKVPISIEVSTLSAQHERFLEAIFESGTASISDSRPEHVMVRRSSESTQPELEVNEVGGSLPLLLELKAFLSYLRGGEPPMSTAEEGLLVVQRIEQCRRLAFASA